MDRRTFDVLIVGAGPAGLAAARRARESGRSIAIIDDNPAPGGQIWRSLAIAQVGQASRPAHLHRRASHRRPCATTAWRSRPSPKISNSPTAP